MDEVLTLLLYLLIMVAVIGVVFAVVWLVFGRSEDLPPLERGTTLTRLPRAGITGEDVRSLRFVQVTRGYKTGEVDWALEKLAREIDELRTALHDLQAREDAESPAQRGE